MGGQAEKADVVRGFEGFGGVPPRSVNDDDGMRAIGCLGLGGIAKLRECAGAGIARRVPIRVLLMPAGR